MIAARFRSGPARVVVVGSFALLLAACAPRPVATADRPAPAEVVGQRPNGRASAAAAHGADEPRRAAAAVKRFRSDRSHHTVARPVSITIPAISVSSRLERLGRTDDGAIEVPDGWQQAGWYVHGPKPGQAGPAVILGHVDSTRGPAVFYRLRELRAGDEVRIARTDGGVVTFVVTRIERHAKARFPTDEVYLPTLQPALRLVTCGGPFDAVSGHYRDNLVVSATLAG